MERLRPALTILGYSAWFGLLFVIFSWVTFPWGKVSEQITVRAADAGIAFQAASLRPAVVGARAKELVVGPLGGDKSPWIQAKKLRVKTGIGGALSAALEVRKISSEGGASGMSELVQRLLTSLGEVALTGDMYGADIDLSASDDKGEAMRLALETGKLDLAAYPIQSDSFAANPTGRLKADADVLWHWEDPKKSSGSVDMTFDQLHLTGFKVQGFALPETTFDRAEAHLKLGKGRAEFRNTAFESDVVEATVEGFINLRKDVLRSTLALRVKFKVRDDLAGLLSVAGLKKDSRHRDNDGWFHYQVQGRLLSPQFKERRVNRPGSRKTPVSDGVRGDEDGGDGGRATKRPKRKPKSTSADDEPISREEMSEDRKSEIEEERARLREERLKRREERRKKREELMQQRQGRSGADEDEEEDVPTNVVPRIQPPDMEDFDRTNDIEIEGEDEGEEFED
jgi:type II secretion system protein N